VKNLDTNIDNKALYDTFSLFGNILSCKVAADENGKSKGYGFVHFESEDSAKQAIERVNGMQIGEKTVQVGAFLKAQDRDSEPKNFTNVYIKHMPADWDDDKIKEVFGKFGTITSTLVQADKKERKFAFVNYENVDDAKKAIEEMNEKDVRTDEQKKAAEEKPEDEQDKFDGRELYVGRAQTKSERKFKLSKEFNPKGGAAGAREGVNLYIKNLDESIDDEKLREHFCTFGKITSAKIVSDDKGTSKGFGFVCFSTPEEATKAVTEMHLKMVCGKPLYVGLAERREQRMARLQQRFRSGPPGMGGMGMGGQGGYGMGGMYGGMGGMGMGGGKGGGKGGPMGGMGGMGMGMGGMGMGGMGMPGMGMGGMGAMGGKGGAMGMQRPGMMPGMMPGMQGGMMRPMMMGGKGMGGMGPMGGKGGPMGGKGAPMQQQRPMGMPGQQMGARPGMMPGQPMMGAQPRPGADMTASNLANAPPGMQKQMLGEKIFPLIARLQPEMAGKITGMMLEMDNSELLILLESPEQLKMKVDEALRVLEGGR